MCWFQGEEHPRLPALNRECIKRWRELNSDYQVNVLTNETIADYVPEFFEIVEASPKRSFAAKSDLLRILLLAKFGGVWVDASVYPIESLSSFHTKIVNETDFFTYRFIPRRRSLKVGHRETVSWFLCAGKPNHPLIVSWKNEFINKFQNLKEWKYYTFHETLAELYDTNINIKHIIDNMIQISQGIPHSAIQKWENRKPSFLYKRPKHPNFTQ